MPGDFSVLQAPLYGWAARQPLEVGARLTATLATEPAIVGVGGEFTLKVVGAPTPLPAPVLPDGARSVFGCALGGAPGGTPALATLAGLALGWLLRRRARRARG